MTITATVRGAEEIARRFANTASRIEQLRTAFDASEDHLRQVTAAGTPVLSGTLQASWRADRPEGGVVLTGHVGSPVRYAPYVERGARGVPGVFMLARSIRASLPARRAIISQTVATLVARS